MAARASPWRVPDRLWVEVEPLIPKVERRFRYPGRRRHDDRACLEGILYALRYAVPWQELPARWRGGRRGRPAGVASTSGSARVCGRACSSACRS